ncbi:TetM/TetW/TetO/TetS family tetracycline resistance ribosomal protection protein [Micromonospora yasonensis]|uniref:elongation factor G n=1 Tax=Micromonospora yasonensis TaxID=1128667 RepID=UPI00222F65FD|nr:TetM/TetW/TetO/TetS family tetracycline resistance ribosomal protection protein [Micromonospora yasonensis]MCW3839724.1 TetM/TetW/TetO/TetS family tetracycline resistance ribosomal protection protein [Micromonospora yasonensis]
MRTLNLGILAHVDAGKTTLTERLLHAAGVIDQLGSVDSGTTQTDSLALERQRGITIRSAVASLRIGGTEVNIIDTPGHPDFIAEVDRVLGVLDGAVLVVSAVEGVQPQTRLLMRALRRLCVPTLIFINKTDRRGADAQRVYAEIARRLDVTVVSATAPTAALADALTSADDALLREYVEDEASVTARRLRAELAAQTARCAVHPLFGGSAMTGAGVDELMAGLADLLPPAAGEPARPLRGRIFKVERGPAGEKVAYVRLFDGELRVRDHPTGGRDRITAIHMLENGVWVRRDTVAAGQIAALRGLAGVRVGDTLGDSAMQMDHHFAPPMLEALAVPRRPGDGGRLRSALMLLAEQDPLINVRADERDGTAVSLYGEVQKEVIQTTLAADFGVDADFLQTTTLCVERPKATGEGLKRLNTPSNPYQATIGLRVEPGPPGSGVTVHVPVDYRLAPLYVYRTLDLFQEAMGDYVRDALAAGPHGWPVTDCVVTMTDSGYSVADGPPSLRGPTSTAQDFRRLTPIVVAQALAAGGTVVCEPLARVTLEVPARAPSGVLSLLSKLGAMVEDQVARADEMVIVAVLTAADAQELHRMLPEVTGGEGVLEAAFAGHRPVRGKPPRRE